MNIKLPNKYFFLLLMSLFSSNFLAANFNYRADVDGMVCAFCAYSVAKNIRIINGVNPDLLM